MFFLVQAKCDRWQRYYKGKITNVNSDGSYDITFEDGDKKDGVDKSLIRGLQFVQHVPIEIAKENGHDAIVQLLTEYDNTKEKKKNDDGKKKKNKDVLKKEREMMTKRQKDDDIIK